MSIIFTLAAFAVGVWLGWQILMSSGETILGVNEPPRNGRHD